MERSIWNFWRHKWANVQMCCQVCSSSKLMDWRQHRLPSLSVASCAIAGDKRSSKGIFSRIESNHNKFRAISVGLPFLLEMLWKVSIESYLSSSPSYQQWRKNCWQERSFSDGISVIWWTLVWVSSVAWCWPTQTNIKGVCSCPLEMANSIILPTLVILSEEA